MTHNGLASMKQAVRNVDLTRVTPAGGRNMGHAEQDASLIAGATLLGMGLAKISRPTGWAMLAAGAGLLHRGLTVQCQLYKALGIRTDK